MSEGPIVAGTDGSPRAELAVEKAGELAQALGAPVHVVCVLDASVGKRLTAQQIVAEAGDGLRVRGLAVQTEVPEGAPAPALVAVADRQRAQMIVVGNKGMTGLRRLLGSVPSRVSHQAHCNVLIVPTNSPSLAAFAGRSIVVGTDGSSRAMRAVKEAIRLSRALDGELRIVSSSESLDAANSALAAAAAEAADQGVNAITQASHEVQHPRGPAPPDPADALLDLAKKNDAAIIVVGSKGMRADERELFGNIPDKLSHKAACGVLIVYTADASGVTATR